MPCFFKKIGWQSLLHGKINLNVGDVRLVDWCTCRPTRRALKKELFWIAYMDCPCMGGLSLVDWCNWGPTHRALKTRIYSRLYPWKVHVWEVFDWWTRAFVDQLIEPQKLEVVLDWFFLLFCSPLTKKYWCFYFHRLRDSVSPVCEIWNHQFELIFQKVFTKTNRFSSLVTKPKRIIFWRTLFNFLNFLD